MACWQKGRTENKKSGHKGHFFRKSRNWNNTKSELFNLIIFQIHRRRPPEDGDADFQATLFFVNFFNHAIEGGKRTIRHANLFTNFKRNSRTRMLNAFLRLLDNPFSFCCGNGSRPVSGAQKPRNLGRILDQMPDSSVISIFTST